MPGEYDKLAAEMDEVMAKAIAMKSDTDADKAIADAAAEADPNAAANAAEDEKKPAAAEGDKGEDEGEPFGKSFSVTLENGETLDAIDGTALVKAMHGLIKGQAAELKELRERVGQQDGALIKVGPLLKALADQIGEQGTILKSLREAPAGRKGALAIPGAGGVAAPALPRGELLAKAITAMNAGRISGQQASVIEARVNRGLEIPADLLAAISAA